jgi:hypothetical protein
VRCRLWALAGEVKFEKHQIASGSIMASSLTPTLSRGARES